MAAPRVQHERERPWLASRLRQRSAGGRLEARFRRAFAIPQILEYYAATEGTFSLYNCEGRPGSIGRIPPFLSHRYPVALVRFDPATGIPIRNAHGRCVSCEPGEIGEAIGRIAQDEASAGARFEGYADADATRAKVLRDVLRTRRRLVPHWRSHDPRRARVLLLRRSHRRHLPLERRERVDDRGRGGARGLQGRGGCCGLWGIGGADRGPRGHGGARGERRVRSRPFQGRSGRTAASTTPVRFFCAS